MFFRTALHTAFLRIAISFNENTSRKSTKISIRSLDKLFSTSFFSSRLPPIRSSSVLQLLWFDLLQSILYLLIVAFDLKKFLSIFFIRSCISSCLQSISRNFCRSSPFDLDLLLLAVDLELFYFDLLHSILYLLLLAVDLKKKLSIFFIRSCISSFLDSISKNYFRSLNKLLSTSSKFDLLVFGKN